MYDIGVTDTTPTPEALPAAWADLLAALPLLARGRTNDLSPYHCEHDQLTVSADPGKFTAAEIAQLDEWGFHHDGAYFYSFRYGSA